MWTEYDWPSGLGINVGARALSSQFGDRGNIFSIDGYGLLNVGGRYARGPIEYVLNINNLTDTEYLASSLYDTQMYPGGPINVLGTIRIRLRRARDSRGPLMRFVEHRSSSGFKSGGLRRLFDVNRSKTGYGLGKGPQLPARPAQAAGFDG